MTFCHLFVAILYSYYWITFHLTLIGIYSFILRSIVHIYRRITNSALYHRSRMNVWRVSFDSSMENVCLFLEMCPKQNGKSTIYRFIRLQTVGIFHEVHNLCRFFCWKRKIHFHFIASKINNGSKFYSFLYFFHRFEIGPSNVPPPLITIPLHFELQVLQHTFNATVSLSIAFLN